MDPTIPVCLSPNRALRFVLACGGVLCLGLLSGCISEPASLGRLAAPLAPAAVKGPKSSAFAPLAAEDLSIIVLQIPPFPQREIALAAPSFRHVWLAGYWTWHNDRYEWMAGHWAEPPGTFSLWIRPRWVRAGRAYRFYEGYWQ